MILLCHIRGRFSFVLFDSQGEGLPIEYHNRAWRRTRFPRDWRMLVRGAA